MASQTQDFQRPSPAICSPIRMHRPKTPIKNHDRPSSSGQNVRMSPHSGSSNPRSSQTPTTLSSTPLQRRARQGPLQLPALPRFHPANFTSNPSASGPTANVKSSDSSFGAANGPLSPRTVGQLRQYSEAQQQLFLYQRELVNLNRSYGPASSSGLSSPGWRSSRPASPQLRPTGSPGPITPLELELEFEADQNEGYLMAGAVVGQVGATGTPLSEKAQEEILESYIQKEMSSTSLA